MFGLNSDPATDASYGSMDYSWYIEGGGNLYFYENGSNIGGCGSYSPSTRLMITYDGNTVRYYKDGVLQRSVTDAGKTFYLDSSFYNITGAGITAINFGQMLVGTEIWAGSITASQINVSDLAANSAFINALYVKHLSGADGTFSGTITASTITGSKHVTQDGYARMSDYAGDESG
jgi:hypothetical protein